MNFGNRSVRMMSDSILAFAEQEHEMTATSATFLEILRETCEETMSDKDFDQTVFEDRLYENIDADDRLSDELKDRPEEFLERIFSLATEAFPYGAKPVSRFAGHRMDQIRHFDSAFAFLNSYEAEDDAVRHFFVEDVKEAVDASGVVILVQDTFDEVVYSIVSEMASTEHDTEEEALRAILNNIHDVLEKAGDKAAADNSQKITMMFLGSLRAEPTPDPTPGLD